MSNALTLGRFVHAIRPALWLFAALFTAHSAHATAGSAKALEGTWCSEEGAQGATIIQYSAAGSSVTAFTVLSEADPRHIGQQSSMQLTTQAPNVFLRRAFDGLDEMFSVHRGRLTVDSLWVSNRGTRNETRQVMTTQSYYKCDVSKALQRAQAFLSSPKAEEATRKALQREAQMKAAEEERAREDAELAERRNADRDEYYANLIRQLNQARSARVNL